MDDKHIEGGAAPALAAHSKDAATSSSNPAASTTGAPSTKSPIDGVSDTVSKLAGQARGQLAEHGITADQATDFVRERPLTALLAAGGLGLILGMLVARR